MQNVPGYLSGSCSELSSFIIPPHHVGYISFRALARLRLKKKVVDFPDSELSSSTLSRVLSRGAYYRRLVKLAARGGSSPAFFTLVRLSDASSSRQTLLFSCFLCVLSFFFLSFLSLFLFFFSFFLSFFRSFFRSFFLSFFLFFLAFFLFLLGAQLSSGLSFSCLSPGRPRVRAGPGVCVGDASGGLGLSRFSRAPQGPGFGVLLGATLCASCYGLCSSQLGTFVSPAAAPRPLAGCIRDRTASSAGRASACFSSSNRFFSARFSACRATRVACTAER